MTLEPEIEVEYMTAALDLAARGLGDTVAGRSVLALRGFARRLAGVPLDPPLDRAFAFITRRDAHLSPATREFAAPAQKRVERLNAAAPPPLRAAAAADGR